MDEFTLLRSAMLYMKEQSTKSKLDFPQLELSSIDQFYVVNSAKVEHI